MRVQKKDSPVPGLLEFKRVGQRQTALKLFPGRAFKSAGHLLHRLNNLRCTFKDTPPPHLKTLEAQAATRKTKVGTWHGRAY